MTHRLLLIIIGSLEEGNGWIQIIRKVNVFLRMRRRWCRVVWTSVESVSLEWNDNATNLLIQKTRSFHFIGYSLDEKITSPTDHHPPPHHIDNTLENDDEDEWITH